MAPFEDEVRRRLAEFAARWGGYQGSERAEAQTFLNQLLECYGVDRLGAGARFEERTEGGFMDLFWPGRCIIEMKRPSEVNNLPKHRSQALTYWQKSGTPSSPAPRYVVLCAFHRFEIWEPGAVYTEPRAVIDLVDLPENLDALNFLADRQPVFDGGGAELTREAVALVTELNERLRIRKAAELPVLRDFILQCVWAMFAEDLHMLPSHVFTRVVQELATDSSRSSADELGRLFEILATRGPRPEHGVYEGVPYANGSLFDRPARVHLATDEVELLVRAAAFNWAKVEPAIFGGLLQGALGKERQWALGAHYTHEADILKVVLPTIVEPWRERIAECRTLADVQRAQSDLMHYVVLDPACGSGNFLYVAYRELRRIEAELRRRESDMRRNAGIREQQTLALYFPLSNMRGIEIDQFAVHLARVTLWMGQKQAVDELGLDHEQVLPLTDMSGIERGDALRMKWPAADAIIGNPPFLGSQRLRGEHGDAYVEWLKSEFQIGVKDYAVYWFRKAHEQLKPQGRAGLVATNSLSQNKSRSESLDYIVENGGVITNAVSSQVWPGEAKVHVSIVDWIKNPTEPPQPILDGRPVLGITSALRAGTARMRPSRLAGNRGVSFQGPIPAGMGFILDEAEALALLNDRTHDYAEVVRRYLMGDDLVHDPRQEPTRWIIDFGMKPLEVARRWPAAMAIVEARVRPERSRNRDRGFKENWWRFGRPRPEMRAALSGFTKCVACNRVGKRLHFAWFDLAWCPGDKIVLFRLDDDFSMGVLASAAHTAWAWELSSTLKADLNYTPTSAFETFPFPQPADKTPVADAARRLMTRRSEICLERQIGLTQLYNELDDGAYRELRELRVALDEAVVAAYGWSTSVAHDPQESNRLLLELNREIATGRLSYHPFR